MKYPIDFKDNFTDTLLFWLSKYVKFKLNSLSNKLIDNPNEFQDILMQLNEIRNIDNLDKLVKKARNLGLIGVNTYFNPLKKMFSSLSKYPLESLKEIDEELIIEILASITSSLSDASKKNYKIAIVNFFNYINSQNEETDGSSYVFDIELKNWSGLRAGNAQKLPEYMTEEQMKLFLKTLNEHIFTNNNDRNKLAIKIILFTGVRVSEVLRLRIKDLSIEDELMSIRIQAKGNKYRVVLLNIENIKEHLPFLKTFSKQDDFIFSTKNNKPITQAYISRLIETILLKAGIRKEKNGAHMLRHSFATLLYKKEKDLLLVQEALGHASLNTSRIYTHFDNEKLKKAAKIASDLK